MSRNRGFSSDHARSPDHGDHPIVYTAKMREAFSNALQRSDLSRLQFPRINLVHVTPDPGFSRLDGTNERMTFTVKVSCRVSVLG